MAADRLLIFCKAPVAGRVKTRLFPLLSPGEAADLYEASLHDVITKAARERGRVELWCDDAKGCRILAGRFPHLPIELQAQGSLGDRQRDAVQRSFADGAARVVLIGSDSPTLPDSHLSAAFDDLHDAPGVIGPTLDGGYYLIGFARSAWPAALPLFDDVEWSTDQVLNQILRGVARLGLDLRMLPGWYDFDVPDDLERLRQDAAAESQVGQWLRRKFN